MASTGDGEPSKRRSAEQTRQLLLDTAVTILHEKGPAAGVLHVRLTDVLARTGLTTGAAYRLWDNQQDFHDALAVAAMRWRDRSMLARTTAAAFAVVSAGGTLEDLLRATGAANVQELPADTGIIADNTIFKAKYGYTAYDSGNVEVYNNSFAADSVWDVGMSQDNRYQPGKGTAGPSVQPSAACPWLVNNITVKNNDFTGANGLFEFYALDKQTGRPADSMNITIDGNLFLNRGSNGSSWPIGWGGSDNSTVTTFATPGAFAAAKGFSVSNASVPAGTAWVPGAMAALSAGSADALPADVAAAIGVPTGTQHMGTF